MRQCTECGKTENIHKFQRKTNYCWAHYLQMRRHGRILPRTKYTPNEFVDVGSHIKIVLYREKTASEIACALIDKRDLPKARKYKWHVAVRSNTTYAETFVGRKSILLHILILGKRRGKEIDHINGIGLDCRRSNLRFLSHNGNILNRHKVHAKSGRMGVTWRKDRQRWVARIIVSGKAIHRHCRTFEEAVAAREAMERLHFGVTLTDLTPTNHHD